MTDSNKASNPVTLEQVHPKMFFGDEWLDYASKFKKAKTKNELITVCLDINEKHGTTIADTIFIFSKVFFPEETFTKVVYERDMFMAKLFFDKLQESNQE